MQTDRHPVDGCTISTRSNPHSRPQPAPTTSAKKKKCRATPKLQPLGCLWQHRLLFQVNVSTRGVFFSLCGCRCVPLGCSPSHPSTEVMCSCLNDMKQKLFAGHDAPDRKPASGFLVQHSIFFFLEENGRCCVQTLPLFWAASHRSSDLIYQQTCFSKHLVKKLLIYQK